MADYSPEVNPLSTTSAQTKSMINLPPRNSSALSGTDFGQSILNLPPNQERDDRIVAEIEAGNIPDRLRTFRPITVESKGNTLQYFVSGDYLSVGSDEDYLRVVVGGKTAKKICDLLNCSLPTKVISDTIWRLADLRLAPHPELANPNMISTKTLIDHNAAIRAQVNGREFDLIAGIKKDIVICKHLLIDRSRLCIFGWHSLTGIPIQQQNSTSHQVNYCDYSQSVRLVSRSATINDQPIDIYDIINNPQLAYLISDEGPYDATTIYQ